MPATLEAWYAPFETIGDTRQIVVRDPSLGLRSVPSCECHPLPDTDVSEEETADEVDSVDEVLLPMVGVPLPAPTAAASPAGDKKVQQLLSDFFVGGNSATDLVRTESDHGPRPPSSYPGVVSCLSSEGGDLDSDSDSQGYDSDQLQSTCGCLDPDCPGMLGWTPPHDCSTCPLDSLCECPNEEQMLRHRLMQFKEEEPVRGSFLPVSR